MRQDERRHLNSGAPGKARFANADHLLGGKSSPRAPAAGAHFAALAQSHRIRNPISIYGTPCEGLNNRRNRRYRGLLCWRAFETRDQRIRPSAKGGRHREVTRQCRRADERDDTPGAQFRESRGLRPRPISQRDPSWHKLFRWQTRNRRPQSSRSICSQASRRKRISERRTTAWVFQITRSSIRSRLPFPQAITNRPSALGGLRE
jgi:hypothetical protein